MSNLNILIVEGNLKEENISFSEVGIPTHTESLKESLYHYTKELKKICAFSSKNFVNSSFLIRLVSKLFIFSYKHLF